MLWMTGGQEGVGAGDEGEKKLTFVRFCFVL